MDVRLWLSSGHNVTRMTSASIDVTLCRAERPNVTPVADAVIDVTLCRADDATCLCGTTARASDEAARRPESSRADTPECTKGAVDAGALREPLWLD